MNRSNPHAHGAQRLFAQFSSAVTLLLLFSLPFFVQSTAYAASIGQGPPEHLKYGQLWTDAKGKVNQSAAFIRAKNAHQINPLGKVTPLTYPSSFTLPITQTFEEPLAWGNQDSPSGVGKGAYYTDEYHWYDCGPGAAAVAMWLWPNAPFPSAGNYNDPHSSLYWLANDGRPDIMHIAYGINPPNSGWTSPGVMTYGAYPHADTANPDELIGMNYEASGESSNWQNYFYTAVLPKNLSAPYLLGDIEYDTYTDGVPPVVSVYDADLPDWKHSGYQGGSHDIAILGYDNSNSTYTYYETCGSTSAGCETSGYGTTYTISQSELYTAIENDNGNGALIW